MSETDCGGSGAFFHGVDWNVHAGIAVYAIGIKPSPFNCWFVNVIEPLIEFSRVKRLNDKANRDV